ncbi:MAG: hypothetical protein ACI9MR_001219 [Myxococcota bacterium]|jgi:hypothetical protein
MALCYLFPVGALILASSACSQPTPHRGDAHALLGQESSTLALDNPKNTEEQMATEATRAVVCKIYQTSTGIAGRTSMVLERERAFWNARAQALIDGQMTMAEPPDAPLVTTGHILDHITSKDVALAESAAYVAGRCRAANEAADGALEAALFQASASSEHAVVRIEAAMSLAVRGHKTKAIELLGTAAASPKVFEEPYKAGLYLAQLGQKSGYTAVAAALNGDINHHRIMAVRSISLLAQFDGQAVDGVTIDLRGLLVARLDDANKMVRREVPAQLVLLKVPDAEQLLTAFLANEQDASVKVAAKSALSSLRAGQ